MTDKIDYCDCGNWSGSHCRPKFCDRPANQARDDAKMYGTGFYRRHPDGHLEHLPHDQVVIYARPNTQED